MFMLNRLYRQKIEISRLYLYTPFSFPTRFRLGLTLSLGLAPHPFLYHLRVSKFAFWYSSLLTVGIGSKVHLRGRCPSIPNTEVEKQNDIVSFSGVLGVSPKQDEFMEPTPNAVRGWATEFNLAPSKPSESPITP